MVWVVGDATVDGSETGTSFRQALGFMEIGFKLHDTMIYLKSSQSYPDITRYYQVFEYMFVFSKGRPKTVHLIRDRKNRWEGAWGMQSERQRDGTLKRKKRQNRAAAYGVRFNVWKMHNGRGHIAKDDFAHEHPAIFPEVLARDHIISWSDPGDVVLDPMCGSGTTLKMAVETGRHYIGIDISEKYCRLAERRVAVARRPLLVPGEPDTRKDVEQITFPTIT